jgi:hypothetical protein
MYKHAEIKIKNITEYVITFMMTHAVGMATAYFEKGKHGPCI